MNILAKKVKETIKGLRCEHYRLCNIQTRQDVVPFGGSIRESIGPFPEFILKGRFCKRSAIGLCSPCFYSRLPEYAFITNDDFNKGYLQQVDYIIDNFEKLVIQNQIGKVAFPIKDEDTVIGLVCTPTGSYFDNDEYPLEVRKTNLKKILAKAISLNCRVALHIEAHANDVLKYFENFDKEEIDLLKQLNARVIIGFESADEFSRNVIYAKELDMTIFLNSINVLKQHGFPVGAFVFAGLFSYTDYETINDIKKTFLFLKEKEISPVLMFANTQKYTISDVLRIENKYKLLDAHTVLEIVKLLINIFGCNTIGNIDPWFIADPKGGPPEPDHHIFISKENTACHNCNNRIYELIEKLRIDKNADEFLKGYTQIKQCTCMLKYDALIEKDQIFIKEKNIEDRTRILLEQVNNMREKYILIENPWVVKAQLLCYGLFLTNSQKEIAAKQNRYVNEKGLIHALHIKYQGTLINVCVAEAFCEKSPFTASIESNGTWVLYKNGYRLGAFEFLQLPNWTMEKVGNLLVGDLVRPHADNCISLWPSQECAFIKEGKGCKFCGLISAEQLKIVSVDDAVKAVSFALDYNSKYEVNISGGTCGSPDEAVDFLIEICSKLKRKYHEIIISVECAPPKDLNKLEQLRMAGASALIINIEIYNDELRKEICPGKGFASFSYYLEALKRGVELFGKGNVSSVIIVGLQPEKDVEKACRELIAKGVIPTLMPFKPLDGTPLQNYSLPSDEEYIRLSRNSAKEMKSNRVEIECKSGCAACGACSIDIDLKEIFKS